MTEKLGETILFAPGGRLADSVRLNTRITSGFGLVTGIDSEIDIYDREAMAELLAVRVKSEKMVGFYDIPEGGYVRSEDTCVYLVLAKCPGATLLQGPNGNYVVSLTDFDDSNPDLRKLNQSVKSSLEVVLTEEKFNLHPRLNSINLGDVNIGYQPEPIRRIDRYFAGRLYLGVFGSRFLTKA